MSISHKDFGDGIAPSRSVLAADRAWWTKDGDEAAKSVSATLHILKNDQTARVAQHARQARLYGNMGATSISGMSFPRASTSSTLDRVTYNVIQSCVDTAQSKMAKNKPKPLFLTSGGDHKQQRKAKKLNQFMDGVFYECDAHGLGIEAFRDGELFGDGFLHVFDRNGRVAYERVLSSALWVDEREAEHGKPRQMHRTKNIDRAVLRALFPGKASAIANAKPPEDVDRGNSQSVSDLVEVRESWHIKSGPDAKDGKHAISVDGALLAPMDAWTHDFFPFARFQWSPGVSGYWSQSGVAQIQSIQMEINKLLYVIQRSFHLAGSFKVLLENGSKIVKEHLNNDIGAIVNYTGTPPQYVTPQIVAPEIFAHLSTLKASAYEQFGISMMNATSAKPAGLNSGKALREYDDIGTDRFLTPGLRYQKLYMDLAKLSIAVTRDIAERNAGHYAVKVPGSRFLRSIDWKEIDIEDDAFVMQCFPISSFPSDPSGRLQTVQEYAQAGYITPRQAKKLLDFPDIEQVESLGGAEEEYLTEILEKMVDDGIYTPPEPHDDLSLAAELASQFYAQGKSQHLDEERLDLLRQFMSQIEQLTQMAAAAMAPPPQMGAPGVAAQPPVSDLLPNAAPPPAMH